MHFTILRCSFAFQVTSVVESKVTSSSELTKYHRYVNELGQVICLLLNVSGRLARAENAVMSLGEDASQNDKVRKMIV